MFEMFNDIVLDDEEGTEQKAVEDKEEIRRKSIKLDLMLDDENEMSNNTSKDEVLKKDESMPVFNGEGFLLKKPPKGLKWEKRYFRIKNGILYWYINERSRESQNKVVLSEVEDCYLTNNKPSKFKISIDNMKGKKKTYKFAAPDEIMAKVWVAAIQKEMKGSLDTEADYIKTTVEGKDPIIKDYDEMKRKEKALEMKKKKEEKLTARKKAKSTKKKEADSKGDISSASTKQNFEMCEPMVTTKGGGKGSKDNSSKKQMGCCDKLLDCLGLGPSYSATSQYYNMKTDT